MRWYFYVAYFFGGAFLVNAVPPSSTACPVARSRLYSLPSQAIRHWLWTLARPQTEVAESPGEPFTY
jgi:hypothetical protein